MVSPGKKAQSLSKKAQSRDMPATTAVRWGAKTSAEEQPLRKIFNSSETPDQFQRTAVKTRLTATATETATGEASATSKGTETTATIITSLSFSLRIGGRCRSTMSQKVDIHDSRQQIHV